MLDESDRGEAGSGFMDQVMNMMLLCLQCKKMRVLSAIPQEPWRWRVDPNNEEEGVAKVKRRI